MIIWSAVETRSAGFSHATSELQKYTVCEVFTEEMRGDLKRQERYCLFYYTPNYGKGKV